LKQIEVNYSLYLDHREELKKKIHDPLNVPPNVSSTTLASYLIPLIERNTKGRRGFNDIKMILRENIRKQLEDWLGKSTSATPSPMKVQSTQENNPTIIDLTSEQPPHVPTKTTAAPHASKRPHQPSVSTTPSDSPICSRPSTPPHATSPPKKIQQLDSSAVVIETRIPAAQTESRPSSPTPGNTSKFQFKFRPINTHKTSAVENTNMDTQHQSVQPKNNQPSIPSTSMTVASAADAILELSTLSIIHSLPKNLASFPESSFLHSFDKHLTKKSFLAAAKDCLNVYDAATSPSPLRIPLQSLVPPQQPPLAA
jgi:hypothetical protein